MTTMPKFQKVTRVNKFVDKGLNLARPQDMVSPFEYQVLRNVRSYVEGEIRSRPGMSALNVAAMVDTNINSGRQLNDSTGLFQSAALVVGAGTHLYTSNAGFSTFTQTTGAQSNLFSGDPLTFVPFRPNQSPNPWFYIADRGVNAKVRVDGKLFGQGIRPPDSPPTGVSGDPNPTINQFQITTLDSGIGTSPTWTFDNVVLNGLSNGVGTTDSAAAFLLDTGFTPGWASVAVTAPANALPYQPGFEISIGGEIVVIDSVYPAMNRPTTISSITYDAGVTGAATIVMTNARKNVVQNSVILFTGTNEYARVLAVSVGKDGLPSIRVNVVNTYTAGSAITGVFSWRAFFTASHVGGSWTFQFISVTGLPAGGGAPPNSTVTGFVTHNAVLDLSSIGGRPIQDSDILNFDVFMGDGTNPSIITEVQFQVVLGNDPSQYYLVSVTPSDFTPLTGSSPTTTLLLQQRKIQRDIIRQTPISPDTTGAMQFQRLTTKLAKVQAAGQQKAATRLQARIARISAQSRAGALADGGGILPVDPILPPVITPPSGGTGGGGHHHHAGSGSGSGGGSGGGTGSTGGTGAPSSSPTSIGSNQWSSVKVQIKDVARVGSNAALTWANVTSLKVQVTATNPSPTLTAGIFLNFGSWWIGGTFGPSITGTGTTTLAPYLYRYGYRSTTTGARSNPGPSTRNGSRPNNSQVQLISAASSDTQVDKVDWFRFGGTLSTWQFLGTSTPGVQFNDSLPDIEVANFPIMMSDLLQPWPILDTPHLGNCNVSGTMVTATSGTFNVNWAQETEIIINGTSQSIYRVLSSSVLEIINNAGNLAGVVYELPDPVIIGQPLPSMWGPYGTGQFGSVMFACGSSLQPETLFWTNPDDPDSASETNQIEVTSPSEPLIAGCMFDGRAFVFSSERMFVINPVVDVTRDVIVFRTEEIPNSKGLWSRWAIEVTPFGIAFLAKDGIYLSTGGPPELLSANLYPIFPHDGIAGVTTGAYAAVDMTQTTKLQLTFIDGRLEFWYRDSGNVSRAAIFNTMSKAWESIDDYTPQINLSFPGEGSSSHARYLCGTDGRVYQSSGVADGNAAINCQVRTRADDLGDSRVLKKFGDVSIDANTNGVNVNVTVGFDLYNTLAGPVAKSNANRFPPLVVDLSAGAGFQSRTITLDFVWSSSTQTVFLYEWMPSYSVKDDSTFLRATEFDDLGAPGAKWIQGIIIRADTGNLPRTIAVQGDNGTNGQMITNLTLTAVSHNGESIIAYPNQAAGWSPFVAHIVRLLPTDPASWILYDYTWQWEPFPELATEWATEFTTLDFSAFGHLRDFNISHISTADLTLTTTYDDGSSSTYTVSNSGGLYIKSYVPARAHKFKAISFTLTSSQPFRLFLKDTSVRVKAWGSTDPYRIVLPFGGMSRGSGDAGAMI